jgi:hypothetical protein
LGSGDFGTPSGGSRSERRRDGKADHQDIEYIPDFFRNYFSIFLGIGANLLAYVILQEKTKKEEKELIEEEKIEYFEK